MNGVVEALSLLWDVYKSNRNHQTPPPPTGDGGFDIFSRSESALNRRNLRHDRFPDTAPVMPPAIAWPTAKGIEATIKSHLDSGKRDGRNELTHLACTLVDDPIPHSEALHSHRALQLNSAMLQCRDGRPTRADLPLLHPRHVLHQRIRAIAAAIVRQEIAENPNRALIRALSAELRVQLTLRALFVQLSQIRRISNYHLRGLQTGISVATIVDELFKQPLGDTIALPCGYKQHVVYLCLTREIIAGSEVLTLRCDDERSSPVISTLHIPLAQLQDGTQLRHSFEEFLTQLLLEAMSDSSTVHSFQRVLTRFMRQVEHCVPSEILHPSAEHPSPIVEWPRVQGVVSYGVVNNNIGMMHRMGLEAFEWFKEFEIAYTEELLLP